MARKDIHIDGKATQFSSENQPKSNGRKPKSFKMFNDLMKERGFEPLTKGQLINAYEIIASLDEATITEIAEDEKQPLFLRLIIAEMTDERTRSIAMKDLRDYSFGKAMQEIKQETETTVIWKEERTYEADEKK